ncbi:hypothetical protein CLAFUW4_10958 [Fulvia fulva]|uniref:Uncharacterized protein n=1 Tax=Passalora fulva TaxID=5499 RepID=A0A9Q8PD19_PASFU|nr:uncharacterized protein CLAFUR5_10000 [Fulvia fulva]KAK4620189.1 hypothetical protein CLAFUR4_10963 [Fulvia fulva]KAK4620886.1 hypothetical protein CLAFUR0_10970 [Fulvia fulva]UJO20301.1 hypothetical protein CLAFUR5_10000 [Fulvia fulva]WPV17280.1 hypothetical protein CLAFUW4_10958 [Fulvia fulva]WPV32415.1 hypothetical protein CLAFUW7_10956 [Fulvia fulva]
MALVAAAAAAGPPFPYCPTHLVDGVCLGGTLTDCGVPGISCAKDGEENSAVAARAGGDPFPPYCPGEWVDGVCVVGDGFTDCGVPGISCGKNDEENHDDGAEGLQKRHESSAGGDPFSPYCPGEWVDGVCHVGGGFTDCGVPGISCGKDDETGSGQALENRHPGHISSASTGARVPVKLVLGLLVCYVVFQMA